MRVASKQLLAVFTMLPTNCNITDTLVNCFATPVARVRVFVVAVVTRAFTTLRADVGTLTFVLANHLPALVA